MAVMKAGQALNLGGSLCWEKYTINEDNLTAAALTQTLALLTLPKGSFIMGYRIKPTTAFAGTAVTAVTVSVGSTSLGTTGIAPAFDIFQAVGAGVAAMGSLFKMGPDADEAINAYFTSVGGNLNAMTAGQVDIYLLIGRVTTPQ